MLGMESRSSSGQLNLEKLLLLFGCCPCTSVSNSRVFDIRAGVVVSLVGDPYKCTQEFTALSAATVSHEF